MLDWLLGKRTKQKDWQRLQGTWKVMDFVVNGQVMDREVSNKITFLFHGDKLTTSTPSELGTGREYSFKIDPSTNPKVIDLTILKGAFKDQTTPAIYELNSDELKLCMPNGFQDRPIGFTAAAGSQLGLFILKRTSVRTR